VDASINTGRQIRNAFQTAVAIAKYEAKEDREKSQRPHDKLHLNLT
jgi:hypothetical protein